MAITKRIKELDSIGLAVMPLIRIARSYTMDSQTTFIIKARILMLLSSANVLDLFGIRLNAQDWWLRTVYLPLTRQGSHVDVGGSAVFGNNYQGNGNCFLTNKWVVVLGYLNLFGIKQTWWLRSTSSSTQFSGDIRWWYAIMPDNRIDFYGGNAHAAYRSNAVVLG